MARTIKKADERRTEILNAAQRLFMSRGYDATTVNDLLDALGGLSKGAFYHHFSSKEDVLHALLLRMAEQSVAALKPLVERPDLSPLEKLNVFFGGGQRFKKENVPALRALTGVLFRDENLRLRIKGAERTADVVAPLLAEVLEAGRAAGDFDLDDPGETARLVLTLGSMVHEAFAEASRIAQSNHREAVELLRKRISAYERAIERLLGIPKHSLTVVDPGMIESFLEPERGEARS